MADAIEVQVVPRFKDWMRLAFTVLAKRFRWLWFSAVFVLAIAFNVVPLPQDLSGAAKASDPSQMRRYAVCYAIAIFVVIPLSASWQFRKRWLSIPEMREPRT